MGGECDADKPAMEDTTEIKQLGAREDLCPEALLEALLGLLDVLRFCEQVQMRQDAHHLWEPMCLQYVQELKRFLQSEVGAR
jgi:hypothetical protein